MSSTSLGRLCLLAGGAGRPQGALPTDAPSPAAAGRSPSSLARPLASGLGLEGLPSVVQRRALEADRLHRTGCERQHHRAEAAERDAAAALALITSQMVRPDVAVNRTAFRSRGWRLAPSGSTEPTIF